MTTTLETVEYYASLLIMQYIGKAKAYATMETVATPIIMPQTSTQTITFSIAPTSGTFVLSYDDNPTASINWNDSGSTIQTKLRAVTGLSSITVSGEITDLVLTVTFTGVTPPALSLVVDSNSLLDGSDDVSITVDETDLIIPLAVQDAFNFQEGSTNFAAGVQLDVIGKYAGVSRTGQGFSTQITLDDADFRSLINIAIFQNQAGSSLYTIQQFLQNFFPGAMYVFDYQDMTMAYFVSAGVGSYDLLQLVITENLLPRPMAVLISTIIYAPSVDFFQCCTYEQPVAVNGFPLNTYEDYHEDWPFLLYDYFITF